MVAEHEVGLVVLRGQGLGKKAGLGGRAGGVMDPAWTMLGSLSLQAYASHLGPFTMGGEAPFPQQHLMPGLTLPRLFLLCAII